MDTLRLINNLIYYCLNYRHPKALSMKQPIHLVPERRIFSDFKDKAIENYLNYEFMFSLKWRILIEL